LTRSGKFRVLKGYSAHVKSRTLVVAHAGGRSTAAPNTLDAFRHAVALGADMIEFDVRRTVDGVLILHHDDAVNGMVLARSQYADVLRTAAGIGYRIPTLEEMLDAMLGRVCLDVELKESGYESDVIRLTLDRGFPPADIIVTSFDMRAVAAARGAHAEVRTGLLVWDMTPQQALDRFASSGADVLGPDCQLLDETFVREAGARRIELMPWTVNDPQTIARLIDVPSVIGIITDEVGDALRIRNLREH
jgi:glycerophosphoryl diester phosphodiesterase